MNIVKFNHSPNWYARFHYNGKLFQKTLKTTNKKLAQKLAQSYYEEVLASQHNIGEITITLGDAIKAFQKTKPKDKNLQQLLNFLYKWIPEQEIMSLEQPLSDLTTSVLERIVEVRRSEGKAEGTIFHTVGYLNRLVKWAKKNGYEVAHIETPKIRVKNARLRYLSYEEEARLLKELDPYRNMVNTDDNLTFERKQDNYDLVVILLDTGARISEITTLKWDKVDLKNETLSLYRSKVNNESVLYMTDRVKEIFNRRFSTSGNSVYVFSNSRGGPKQSVKGIKNAIERAGLDECVIHTLRHTHASRLVQMGMSLHEVANQLGHADISMTTRYAHLSKAQVSEKARDILNSKGTNYKQGTNYKSTETYTNSYTTVGVDIYENDINLDTLLGKTNDVVLVSK